MANLIQGKSLDLQSLADGRPGITPHAGGSLAEAAVVCLEDQEHSPGIAMRVRGHATGTCMIHWQASTDQMRRYWNDYDYTTEHGAYGLAVLLAELITGWTVVEKSERGTHIDFWLGKEDNEDELPFANKSRLEVTGIRNGNDSKIAARMRAKFARLAGTIHPLPAMVIVVEFGSPVSEVQQR